MIIKNPILLFIYDGLRYLGFKNYDIICNILDDNIDNLKNYFNIIYPYSRKFINNVIQTKGELFASKLIISNSKNRYLYSDTTNLFFKIMLLDKNAYDIKTVYKKNGIKNIHDNLSVIYNNLKHCNRNIPYNNKEKILEKDIDGFSFELAKDTYELIKVGTKMHICVGSYDEKALNKKCNIVIMKKNNEPVGCIELEPKTNTLIQAKAVCNNLLQEKKAKVLKKWVESNGIKSKNCYDYEHIALNHIEYDKDKIYTKDYHYDHIRIDNEGIVNY